MSKKEPKVAIVHDWLVGYAGGVEKKVFLLALEKRGRRTGGA